MNSTNPAEFEAYLAQFPSGVFRALAEARLAALGNPANNARNAGPEPAGAAGNDARAQEQPFRPGAGEPACAGQAEGAACWMELESHPGCYVWNPHLRAGATATWTAGCAGGLASGSGTLKWVWDDGAQEATGTLRDGRRNNGHWVFRFANGNAAEGPLVDGKQTSHWVLHLADGTVQEGPFVDGEANGHWVLRYPNGNVSEGPYVDGERNGRWVLRFATGTVDEGLYVDGEKHGRWVTRYPDGTTETETWVAGEIQ